MYVTCSENDFFPYSLVYFPFLQSSKSTMHSRIDIIFFLKCWNDSGVIALCMNTDVWQKMMWDLMQIQNCKFYTPTYLTLYVSNIFYRHNFKKKSTIHRSGKYHVISLSYPMYFLRGKRESRGKLVKEITL